MSNYVKATDFASKDALTTGDPLKIIKGTEINTEFNNIQTAIATKADLASPAFTGNPTATTQASGNSSSRLATTAFVQGEISANESNVAITGGTIEGVAITGGTISGLATDLAVADGGTGASSFTLNSVILGNNIGALNGNMVAPGTSGNILTSNGTTWLSASPATLGYGQTYQDVTGSRSAGVTYKNTSGKPIFVCVSSQEFVNNAASLSAIVNGIEIIRERNHTNYTGRASISFIVPNEATYSVSSSPTAIGIGSWVELR